MNSRTWLLAISVASWVATPAGAEEILHFKSGATMPVRAHEVRGEMIHVDLGGDAFMAFPAAMIERIESAGADVLLNPSFNAQNNIIRPGPPDPSGSFPVRGQPTVRAARLENEAPDPHVDVDPRMGVAVYRPDPFGSPAKRSEAYTGRMDVLGRSMSAGNGYRGTTRLGNKFIVGSPTQATGGRATTVGVLPRRGGGNPPAPVPAPTPPPNDGSGD